jgi:2-dehydropantoate 2-reductase
MGAGGVGGYFGARLAQGGADVTFVARGAHLEALRANGLTIEGGPERIHVPRVKATDDPTGVNPVDLIMFCVKLWDTEKVARSLLPIIGPQTSVISFQNGVLKDEMLCGIVSEQVLLGGVAYVATTIAHPGVIGQTGAMQRLIFGEFGSNQSARTKAFHHACKAGGINVEVSSNIRREIWQKYVFLVGLSGATTTMRAPIGSIRKENGARQFLLDLMKETVAVGRAHGVDLPEDYAEDRLAFIDSLPETMTSSMHHDLQRGNRLEVRWLSGGVVTLGARVDIPTPANRAVRDILSLHEDGERRD